MLDIRVSDLLRTLSFSLCLPPFGSIIIKGKNPLPLLVFSFRNLTSEVLLSYLLLVVRGTKTQRNNVRKRTESGLLNGYLDSPYATLGFIWVSIFFTTSPPSVPVEFWGHSNENPLNPRKILLKSFLGL